MSLSSSLPNKPLNTNKIMNSIPIMVHTVNGLQEVGGAPLRDWLNYWKFVNADAKVYPEESDVQAFIDQYLAIYPEIKDYMENIVVFAKEHEFVETIMKRRRYIPELKSPVFMQRAFGERTALNAPIQGSAADILKKAMIDLYKYLKKHKKKSKLLLQVHDELILDVPPLELEEMQKIVPQMMGQAIKLKVELETSCDIGKTWYDLK